MAERQVDTLLLVAEHDPGIQYVDEHHGDEMQQLASVRGFRREDIPGTDHHFTSVWAQEYVLTTVVDHLQRSYSA